MTIVRGFLVLIVLHFVLCKVLVGQQTGSSPATGDSVTPPVSEQGQSLGDIARKLRKDDTAEVKMTPEEAKELFGSVDKISAFAAQDSGFPRRSTIKRQLISSSDVEKYTRAQEQKTDFVKRFARSELTMKKLGLLPRDFNLGEFLVKANGKQIAGFYDNDTKTISLLNWIPLDRQAPILAHELTHALQDQNYDLRTWMEAGHATGHSAIENAQEVDNSDSDIARRAIVEGQAMVVMIDYLLAPVGRTLQNTPGLIDQMEEPAVKAAADSELLHNAPIIMREAGTFPYREGVIFEGELLEKGGKRMAFAGVFARPPADTHQVLHPKAYMSGETTVPVRLPDLRQFMSDKYEVYDSGAIGELDVRTMLKQYGEKKAADDVAAAWQGGAYMAFRRATHPAANPPTSAADPTTADLEFLYVSHWKSADAAQRFARIYSAAVSQRYRRADPGLAESCAGTDCPVSATQISTEEGPVIVEQWPDNTVRIAETFDAATAAKLLIDIGKRGIEAHAKNYSHEELSLRLYSLPMFSAFQAEIGATMLKDIQVAIKAK